MIRISCSHHRRCTSQTLQNLTMTICKPCCSLLIPSSLCLLSHRCLHLFRFLSILLSRSDLLLLLPQTEPQQTPTAAQAVALKTSFCRYRGYHVWAKMHTNCKTTACDLHGDGYGYDSSQCMLCAMLQALKCQFVHIQEFSCHGMHGKLICANVEDFGKPQGKF